MENFVYKTFTTSRELVYNYLHHQAEDITLPVLLFLHGFPTTSSIWHHQLIFFRDRGFGLLAPDILGYGGTSKPTDPQQYRTSLVCQDLLELLDAEHIQHVVVIGHGLGVKITSHFANMHCDRFKGFAFLAVPYCAPRPRFDIHQTAEATRSMCGYELVGQIMFYAEDDAPGLIKKRPDSFLGAMFPEDPKIWATDVAPIGALRRWLEGDKRTKVASYLSDKDVQAWYTTFADQGFDSPLCWYKAHVDGLNADDDKSVPLHRYEITQPVFYAAALHDYIFRSVLGTAIVKHHCRNATIREFNAGHWVMLACAAQLNYALNDWILDLVV